MAYDKTEVPVSRSQDAIRKLIMAHSGFAIAFSSDVDPTTGARTEGFHAKVMIDKNPYAVRITAHAKKPSQYLSDRQREAFVQQEERRIWRVLFYHLKGVYEAADSGVMEFRELMLPYLVTAQGDTIAERLLPHIDAALQSNRLLVAPAEIPA